jgi:transcriptional regulator with XRE-family HTH domain
VSLSEVVRKIRSDRHITQVELASRLGVTKSYICKVESGATNPGRRFIAKLARMFGLEERELLVRSGRLPEGMEGAIALSILKEVEGVEK